MTFAISSADLRNSSISDGVSIRGVGDVPNLRCNKAVEGVSDMVGPLHVKLPPVVLLSFMRHLRFGGPNLAE